MSLKNLIIGTALVLGAGAGVSATVASQNASRFIETSASTSETTFYVDVRSSLWGSSAIESVKIHLWGPDSEDVYMWSSETGRSILTIDGVQYVSFSIEDYSDATGVDVYCYDRSKDAHITEWITFSSFSEGQNLIIVGSNGSWEGGRQPYTLDTLDVGTTCTITKLAVEFVGGVAQSPADWGLGSDEVSSGDSYAVPSGTTKNLEHFVGWYTNDACTTAYVEQEIEDDLTIYAKYERLSLDSYFYWLDKDSTDIADGYAYFWGEYQTAYDGDSAISLEDCKVSDVLRLEDQGHLYKIPVPSSGNISVLLHNSDGNVKTIDITSITRGAVYYTWYSHKGDDNKYYYNYSANSKEGLASDFLVEFESYRNAVPASGSIAQYSICGISASNAAYLYGKYEGLDSAVQTLVNNSCTYTYAGTDTSKEETVYFSSIMPQIYKLALKDSEFAKDHGGASVVLMPIAGGSPVVIAIVASAAAVAAVAGVGYFLLRKKKEN